LRPPPRSFSDRKEKEDVTPMEFWRIYRLVLAKRALIGAIVLVAGLVILAGATLQAQQKKFEATASMSPQDAGAPVGGTAADAAAAAAASAGMSKERREDQISELIMLLRTNNDLHLKVAGLLNMPEKKRAQEVQRILDKNGFFASYESDVEGQGAALVKRGELTPDKLPAYIKNGKNTVRNKTVQALAYGRDDDGQFAANGLGAPNKAILNHIRETMTFNPVASPLGSAEEKTEYINQVEIKARGEREAETKLYANIMCVAFMDYYTSKSAGAQAAKTSLLEKQLESAKTDLQKARDRQTKFEEGNTVAPLSQAQNAALQTKLQYEISRDKAQADYNAAVAQARVLEAQLQQTPRQRTQVLPTAENPQVKTAQDNVDRAQAEFNRVVNSAPGGLGENDPRYQQADSALKSAKRAYQEATARPYTATRLDENFAALQQQVTQVRSQRDGLAQTLQSLNQQVAEQEKTLASLPRVAARLADLQRQVLLGVNQVANLEQKLNEVKLRNIDSSRAGSLAIASFAAAEQLNAGLSKQRWKLMTYGMALALIFGIAIVVAMDALDNSIRSATDVEKLLGLPICGVIPSQLSDPARAPKITYLDPLSPVAEAYRLLRTDLLFTHEEKPFQSLMVSTGKPGQGATTTISNLAITLAQSGKRVILVDADLRRPKLHNVFQTTNDVGLTSLLNDQCDLESALKTTEIDNLLLLPSGPLPLNPSELLQSPRMKSLHEQLRPHTDFILFDTPSAIAFADATILSSLLDATLMVIRANNVPRGAENQVRTMLNKAKANIIGVVLNGMNPEYVDSVHYHYHYYPVVTSKNLAGALPSGPGGNGRNGSLPPVTGNNFALPRAADHSESDHNDHDDEGGSGSNGGGGDGVTTRVAAQPGGARTYANGSGGGGTATLLNTEAAQAQTQTPYDAYSAASDNEPFLQTRERTFWGRLKWKTVALVAGTGLTLGALVLALSRGGG